VTGTHKGAFSMKTKLFSIIAIAIIAIGCQPGTTNPEPDFDQHVTLDGDDVVGGKMTATITGTGGEGILTLKIGDKVGATYDIGFGDAGKSIKASAVWTNGTAESDPITVKTPTLEVELEESDKTNDGLYVGEKLTMTATVGNVKEGLNPDITYTWKVGNDTIGGGKELTVTNDHADKTITGTAQLTDYAAVKASKSSPTVKKPTPIIPPVEQSKTWSGINTTGGTANVTVNYMALPGVVPDYMSTLETVVKNIIPGTPATGNLTINVIAGNDGFAKSDPKTLSVGESWISSATEREMGRSMNTVLNSWVTTIKSNTHMAIQPTHDKGWQRLTAAKIRNGNRIARHMSRGQRLV